MPPSPIFTTRRPARTVRALLFPTGLVLIVDGADGYSPLEVLSCPEVSGLYAG